MRACAVCSIEASSQAACKSRKPTTDGLKRTLKVVVGSSELNDRFTARLDEVKDTVQLKGFRRGKVPVQHIRRSSAAR